jgi:glycosyltransferase involved in cell wall biosynthesis
MKIAIFYHLDFGGAKRIVMEHARGLTKKGHTVDLYVVNHENDIFDPSPYCANVFKYTFSINSQIFGINRFIKDYKNFVSLKKLHQKIAQEIDNRDYDVVLLHPDIFTQAPFLLRFLKTPNAYYCQEPLRIVYEYSLRVQIKLGLLKRSYEELTRLYRKKIDRENVRAAKTTIASCYYVRERMIESYAVYPKVIYCAIDEKSFIPQNIKKKNEVFYVGSPSVWEDGYDLAKDAIELIPKEIRPELHVVSWRKSNGERLSEKELVNHYCQAITTLCTSRLETFGLVPIESMACGTPVIATNVSGHRETVDDGKTGYLVDFDPQEIADRIMFFIQNPDKTSIMGENARKHIEKYWTWEKPINELEALLKSLVIN